MKLQKRNKMSNENLYLKLLSENTKIAIKATNTMISSLPIRGVSSLPPPKENIETTFFSGVISNIYGLPITWLLARERLINNAKVLNNGWKVDWKEDYDSQAGRSYIYANHYDRETNTFIISETYAVWKQSEDGLIFKNRRLAQKFIEENQEDLQIYFSL